MTAMEPIIQGTFKKSPMEGPEKSVNRSRTYMQERQKGINQNNQN